MTFVSSFPESSDLTELNEFLCIWVYLQYDYTSSYFICTANSLHGLFFRLFNWNKQKKILITKWEICVWLIVIIIIYIYIM